MFTLALFLITTVILEPGAEDPAAPQDISHYLPGSGELGEWEPVGSSQKFVGEDLYLYINGGATIYYEYGFRQVVIQEYINKDGKAINLEIFEMKSPASAYGIYTFKSGDTGKELALGNEALLEHYYLNFWKGRFLVTLTAYDSEEETVNNSLVIAQAVAAGIEVEARRPPLPDLLIKENLKSNSIKYLKGNVALSNSYEFDAEDIFGLKEGVIGDYGDYRLFIFKYNNENESMKRFKNAKNQLKENSRFDDFVDYVEEFSMMDKQGEHIRVKPYGNYILIYLGTAETDPAKILETLEIKIEAKQF
jgi:hypothetical protein